MPWAEWHKDAGTLHHQHPAASFHTLSVQERTGQHKRGVCSGSHSGQTDRPGSREKVRHKGSRKHAWIALGCAKQSTAQVFWVMCCLLQHAGRVQTPTTVSELMIARSDLPVFRGVWPQASAVYEENKLLWSSEDLNLQADVRGEQLQQGGSLDHPALSWTWMSPPAV